MVRSVDHNLNASKRSSHLSYNKLQSLCFICHRGMVHQRTTHTPVVVSQMRRVPPHDEVATCAICLNDFEAPAVHRRNGKWMVTVKITTTHRRLRSQPPPRRPSPGKQILLTDRRKRLGMRDGGTGPQPLRLLGCAHAFHGKDIFLRYFESSLLTPPTLENLHQSLANGRLRFFITRNYRATEWPDFLASFIRKHLPTKPMSPFDTQGCSPKRPRGSLSKMASREPLHSRSIPSTAAALLESRSYSDTEKLEKRAT
jgi:hypothetical protein